MERAGLTVVGTGVASGTYGDQLSSLNITGLTAKLGDTVIAGNWLLLLEGDNFPSVGDAQQYTAAFTAEEGADNYETLTAPVSLSIKKAELSAKTGQLLITNGYAKNYSYDLRQLLPDLATGLTYGEVNFTLEEAALGAYYTSGGKIEDGSLLLPINAVDSSSEEKIGTVTIGISSDNYQFSSAIIEVSSLNKEIPQGAPVLSKTELVYPALLSEITLTGTMKNEDGAEVEGTFFWNIPDMCYSAGTYQAEWTFKPADDSTYANVSGSSEVTVKKAAGEGSVTMADWTEGTTASEPVAVSSTNPTEGVTFSYKVKDADDSTYSSQKPSQAGTYTVRAVFPEAENYGEVIATADFTIKPAEAPSVPSVPDGLWMEEIPEQTYNGKAIKPEVKVYYKDRLLTNKDYTVSYKNNTQAAASDAVNARGKSIAPTIVIKGKGNYKGTVTRTFTINPIDLSTYQSDASLQEILKISPVYAKKTGKKIEGVPAFKLNGKSISVKTKQYTLAYNDSTEGAYVESGTYTITIQGTGKNFVGSTTVLQTISDKLISRASITLDQTSYPYNKVTGETYPGKVTVKEGGATLEENVHYTVSYLNYDRIGTATVVVTGKGDYSGVKTKTYKITGSKLSASMVEQLDGFTYEEKEHSVTEGKNFRILDNGTPLEAGKDYNISYSGDRVNAGSFKVTFTGINQYSGSVTKTYRIEKVPVSSLSVTLANADQIAFAKNGATPKPEVRFGNTLLTEGKDYSISYINNKKTALKTDSAAPGLYLIGKGNFTGNTKDAPVQFSIVASSLAEQTTLTVEDVLYKNKKNNYVPKITLTDKNSGKKLTRKTDYSADFSYEIWNEATGRYEPFTGERVEEPTERTRMRITVSGAGSYSGTIQAEYELYRKSITSVKVSRILPQEYTGEEITPIPEVTIRVKEGSTYKNVPLEKENYEISYANNVNKGTATLFIHGKGEYGGMKKVSFKIISWKMSWWESLLEGMK